MDIAIYGCNIIWSYLRIVFQNSDDLHDNCFMFTVVYHRLFLIYYETVLELFAYIVLYLYFLC